MPPPFSDKDLQTYSINDFTPGIVRWSRVNATSTYAPVSPEGSAAHAYRCWAKQGIGLLPFPTYQVAQTYSVTDVSNPLCVSLGNMMTLTPRGGPLVDIVSAFLVQHGTGSGPTDFHITRIQSDLVHVTPVTLYTSTASTFPSDTSTWPHMDHAVFQDTSTHLYSRTVITTDPVSTAPSTNGSSSTGKWVTVRGWTTPTVTTAPESSSGTFPLLSSFATYPRVFYHGGRVGIWEIEAASTVTNNFVSSDTDVLQVTGGSSADFTPTTYTTVGSFFPEMGTSIGSWGSFSTGELVVIYAEGGAVLMYGDPLSASGNFSLMKLTGVMGTGGAAGRAALSPIGMIYPRYNEAVYLWNGDNTAQNISRQVPEGVFTRTKQANGFAASNAIATSTATWGEWVMFPNNWIFDTTNQSWWLCEDPNVINFQVHAGGDQVGGFLSAPGFQYSTAGQPCTLNTYYWQKTSAASSYFWQSNPIPVTVGALVTIMYIEIVASNHSSTPATITIQPTAPPATTSFPNQNGTQQLVFTIPPSTSAYRASQRLGYADYNVCLAVTAANAPNPAPILHAINCSYTQTRTSNTP